MGDTRGAAGIFRFLRTVPVMLDILSDIQRYCPGAVFLNYTNPMAMLCRAMQEAAPEVTITGLCHSVQGGIYKFAQILGVPRGRNHLPVRGHQPHGVLSQAGTQRARPLPELRRRTLEDKEVYESDIVRNEVIPRARLLCHRIQRAFFGIFALVPQAGRPAPGILLPRHQLEHGPHQLPIETREERARNFPEELRTFLTEPIDLARGNEYASHIFNAMLGDGTLYKFNGNVRNFGLVDNLPYGACVEVPVVAGKDWADARTRGQDSRRGAAADVAEQAKSKKWPCAPASKAIRISCTRPFATTRSPARF